MEHIAKGMTGALGAIGIERKAIPTRYRGTTFRSRTEARWALCLHRLGVAYEYEPEGFDLRGMRYLPDFRLPKLDCWLEVKPPTRPLDRERDLCHELATATGQSVYLAAGLPERSGGIYAFRVGPDGLPWWDEGYSIAQCPRCGSIGFEFDGYGDRVCGMRCYTSDGAVSGQTETVIAAMEAARLESFWQPLAR